MLFVICSLHFLVMMRRKCSTALSMKKFDILDTSALRHCQSCGGYDISSYNCFCFYFRNEMFSCEFKVNDKDEKMYRAETTKQTKEDLKLIAVELKC